MSKLSVPQKFTAYQKQIEIIVINYAHYKEQNEITVYLRALAYYLKLPSDPNADVMNYIYNKYGSYSFRFLKTKPYKI